MHDINNKYIFNDYDVIVKYQIPSTLILLIYLGNWNFN